MAGADDTRMTPIVTTRYRYKRRLGSGQKPPVLRHNWRYTTGPLSTATEASGKLAGFPVAVPAD